MRKWIDIWPVAMNWIGGIVLSNRKSNLKHSMEIHVMSKSEQIAPTLTFDPPRPAAGSRAKVSSPHLRGLTGLRFQANDKYETVPVVPLGNGEYEFTAPQYAGGFLILAVFESTTPIANLMVT
ncbi:hypothetical protein [Pseudomonas gingeri]